MYLRLLKKDLKRKKAMNVILLIFIILASMFVSADVAEDIGLEIGDKMIVKNGGVSSMFTFAGGVRDAVLGSSAFFTSLYTKNKVHGHG